MHGADSSTILTLHVLVSTQQPRSATRRNHSQLRPPLPAPALPVAPAARVTRKTRAAGEPAGPHTDSGTSVTGGEDCASCLFRRLCVVSAPGCGKAVPAALIGGGALSEWE